MSCSWPRCVCKATGIKCREFQGKKEPKKTIAKKSPKRVKEDPQYKKIVAEMAGISKLCEIKSPDCTRYMQGLQHMKRRGANLLNRKYLIRACNACNLYCETHPKWAFENGFAISKFKPDEK